MVLSAAVDTEQFWALIDDARGRVQDPADGDAVAAGAAELLAALPREEILAAARVAYSLMTRSYLAPLWAAAYLINGGCSDDGFDYFRGWLIMQGRAVFEGAVADPDALAGLAPVRASIADGSWLDCEDALSIAETAYEAATGEEVPDDVVSDENPDLDPAWDFDFDDQAEMERRLPRLAALCSPGN